MLVNVILSVNSYETVSVFSVKRPCHALEHECGNGRCLKKDWACDNFADCPDGSDETQSLCSK